MCCTLSGDPMDLWKYSHFSIPKNCIPHSITFFHVTLLFLKFSKKKIHKCFCNLPNQMKLSFYTLLHFNLIKAWDICNILWYYIFLCLRVIFLWCKKDCIFVENANSISLIFRSPFSNLINVWKIEMKIYRMQSPDSR